MRGQLNSTRDTDWLKKNCGTCNCSPQYKLRESFQIFLDQSLILPSSPGAVVQSQLFYRWLSSSWMLPEQLTVGLGGAKRTTLHRFLKWHRGLVTGYINTAGIHAGKRHSLHELSASTPRPPAADMTQGKVGACFCQENDPWFTPSSVWTGLRSLLCQMDSDVMVMPSVIIG